MTEHEERDPELYALMPLDTQQGPALRNRPDRNAALVESALAEWQAPALASRRSPWATLAMAASILLGVGLAARALYVRVTDEPQQAASVSQSAAPLPAPRSTPAVEAKARDVVHPVREEPSAVETRKARQRGSEDWLKRGNRLRAEGRFQDAVTAYSRVVREDNGASAYVARVAAGSLKLEHLNDPRGAQALFLAAQKQFPGGSLEVEIERGLAQASRRLLGSDAP